MFEATLLDSAAGFQHAEEYFDLPAIIPPKTMPVSRLGQARLVSGEPRDVEFYAGTLLFDIGVVNLGSMGPRLCVSWCSRSLLKRRNSDGGAQ